MMKHEKCYVLTDWHRRNETYESRRLKSIGWFAMPTADFACVWGEIVADDDGAAVAGCWLALHFVAATSTPRGMLIRHNGRPHDTKSLAAATRLPEPLVRKSLERLLDLGLIREHPTPLPDAPAESAGVPAESAGDRQTDRQDQPDQQDQQTNQTNRPTNQPAPATNGADIPANRPRPVGRMDGHGAASPPMGKVNGDWMDGHGKAPRSDPWAVATRQVAREVESKSVADLDMELICKRRALLAEIGVEGHNLKALSERKDLTIDRLMEIIGDVWQAYQAGKIDKPAAVLVKRLSKVNP